MAEAWQNTLNTWESKISYLHGKEDMSDCCFIFENTKIRIPAHKFVLASCSTFFHLNLISKNLNEIILVQNVSLESLKSFIYYLYNGTTTLTLETLWDIIKMAKESSFGSLQRHCDDFLENILNSENVLDFLDNLQKFNLPKSEAKCYNILTTTNVIFGTFEKVLNLNCFRGNEAEIYGKINKWVEDRSKITDYDYQNH